MFFKASDRRPSEMLRDLLKAGTIFGAGMLVAAAAMPTRADAEVITTQNAGISRTVSGADEIVLTTSGAGASDGGTFSGIKTKAEDGATTIDVGADVRGSKGLWATSSTGAITIRSTSGGTITGANQYEPGILASSDSGALTIDLGADVEGGSSGIRAISGALITITTRAKVTGNGDQGIYVYNSGSDTNVGGDAGLGGAISGHTIGIAVNTGGLGKITIKTASGSSITGNGFGIETSADNGATKIIIGAGSTVTGATAIHNISNDGHVVIDNAGTVKGSIVATSNGGTGTFTFNNSGTLALADIIQSNQGFTLNNLSGGTLTGTGAFGAVTAVSSSTISPGDRTRTTPAVMGVMTMSSVTMAAGAKLEVRADASGVNDKLTVTGAATIATGAVLYVKATPQTTAAWGSAIQFTVLEAGSLSGNFTATGTDYAFLKVTSAKDGNKIIATLERGWTSFGAYSTSPNQKSVSDVFDAFQTQASNPLITKVSTLTVQQAPIAMSQLSGTGVATARTQAFAAGGVFTNAIYSEMSQFTGSAGGGVALSYAADKKITEAFDKVLAKPAEPILDGRVWAHVLGSVANRKADTASPSERSSNYGLVAGVDTALNANLRLGFALSGGQSSSKVAGLATKADAVWGQGALYGVATDGDRYAKASLIYGRLTTETERTVTAFSTPETAKGKFGANLFSTRLEVGQKFATGGPVNVTTFATFEPSWLMQDSYAETGAATIGLGYGKTTTRALPTTLGMKFHGDFALEAMRIAPMATLGWVHNFADTAGLSPFFTSLPGSTFTVAGAKGDRNLARTEFNLEATPDGSTATFYANARADLGARTSAVRGTVGAMLRF